MRRRRVSGRVESTSERTAGEERPLKLLLRRRSESLLGGVVIGDSGPGVVYLLDG